MKRSLLEIVVLLLVIRYEFPHGEAIIAGHVLNFMHPGSLTLHVIRQVLPNAMFAALKEL